MKIQLRDTNSKLKMEIDFQVFEVMTDKGILISTTESVKKYTNGVRKTAFTFNEDLVFISPIGKIYLWENDFITIEY